MTTSNLRNILKKLMLFLLPALLFTSCMSYYKATKIPLTNSIKKTDSLNAAGKYFILQNGAIPLHISNVRLNIDDNTMACTLITVDREHTRYTPGMKKGHMHYSKRNSQKNVLSEVHFYAAPDTSVKSDHAYLLNMGNVHKIEVIEKDKARSTSSHILGYAIGGITAALGVAAIIGLTTLGSWAWGTAAWF